MGTQEPSHPPLLRALRRRDIIGFLINTMVGSGMLAGPAKVFGLAGDWSIVMLLVAGLLIAPLILVFADLGSRFTGTGGPYLYVRAALPGWMAFSAGWLLWISQAFSTATLSSLLVSYLAGFWPVLGEGLPRAAVLITLGVTVTYITLRGIRQSAGTSNLFVVLKLAFIVGFIVAGLAFVHPARLEIATPPPPPITFAQAILIYIYAYSGFERASVIAGEAKDPTRDVPIALLAALAISTVAYGGVLLVCLGVLDNPAATDRPLAEVGRLLFGPAGQAAVSAGAAVVITGTIMVATVGMARMLLALSEQGQLPRMFGAVHPTWRTPHVAIIISSSLAYGLAIMSNLITTLTFATATRVLCYILCCVALMRLARRPDAPAARFNLPARGVFAFVSAALFAIVLIMGATKELPALAGVLVVGWVIQALTHLRRPTAAPQLP
jgi:APA family basic amino acid/polyamine antiporter